MFGALGGSAGTALIVGTVVACSSTASTIVYAQYASVQEEWNLGSDYVPYYAGYQKGRAASTTLTADTKPGDSGASTTYEYVSDGSFEARGGVAPQPFRVTYEWTVLPSIKEWQVPTVDHLADVRQRYYSLFYDANTPAADPGSAQSRFVAAHDGDTFTLPSSRNQDLSGPLGLIKGALVRQNSLGANEAFDFGTGMRLFGVDTPEVSYPLRGASGTTFPLTDGTERLWADRATQFVRERMGVSSTLAAAPLLTVNGKETYSRTVGNVKYVPRNLAGTADTNAADKQLAWNDLGADLVRFGLARVAFVESSFTTPTATMPGVSARNKPYLDYLIELQAQAVSARVGLWATAREQWWGRSAGEAWNPGGAVFPKGGGLTTSHGLG